MYSLHWVTPTGLNKTDGWARCVGEWREREWLRSLILLKPPSGRAHLLSFSAFPTFYVDVTGGLTVRTCLCAVFAPKVDLQEYYHAHMWYCCDFGCTRPLPGSSSHERSSELISARLGVRLRSSESESASSTLTTLLWLWESGSGDAPRSNSKKNPKHGLLCCASVFNRNRKDGTYSMCGLKAEVMLVHILGKQDFWPHPSVLTQLIWCKWFIVTYVVQDKKKKQKN